MRNVFLILAIIGALCACGKALFQAQKGKPKTEAAPSSADASPKVEAVASPSETIIANTSSIELPKISSEISSVPACPKLDLASLLTSCINPDGSIQTLPTEASEEPTDKKKEPAQNE